MGKAGLTAAAANALTDPGVLFSVGNAVFASENPAAFTLNMATASLCFAIRGTGELRNAGIHIPAPERFNKLVENPGTALATSGAIILASAIPTIADIDLENTQTILPTAVLTAFGSASTFMGLAQGQEEGSVKRRAMDAAGILSAALGLSLSNLNAPLLAHAAYAATAAISVNLALRNKQAHGLIQQPYLFFAAINTVNLTQSPNVATTAANALWAAGYVSVDALKKTGGLVQSFAKAVGKVKTLFTGNKMETLGTDKPIDTPEP